MTMKLCGIFLTFFFFNSSFKNKIKPQRNNFFKKKHVYFLCVVVVFFFYSLPTVRVFLDEYFVTADCADLGNLTWKKRKFSTSVRTSKTTQNNLEILVLVLFLSTR